MVQRDEKGRVMKGSRLNTKGSAVKIANLVRFAQEAAGDGRIAFMQIKEIAEGKDPKARTADRLRAWEIILERGWGKAIDIHAMVDLTHAQTGAAGSTVAHDLLESLMRQLPAATKPAEVVEGELVEADETGE